jgi:hypothetical protein
MPPSKKFTTALLEQHLAELSDEDFDDLVARTRPPRLPSDEKPRPDGKLTAADAVRVYMKGH